MANSTSTQRTVPANLHSAKTCFGDALKAARERAGLSQAAVAKLISRSRVVVSNFESGEAAPEPDQAVALAKALHEDVSEFVLLATLQRGLLGPDVATHNDLLNTVNALRDQSGNRQTAPQRIQRGLPGYLSLADGIGAFGQFVIFVGDKREEEPQSAGDLFVFSSSTVDDRWVLSLGLPSDTEKISDKVLMTARDGWLRKQFGQKNIISIGSAASNLFSRQFNDHFLFRFAISRTTQKKWDDTRKKMLGLDTPARLLQFYDESKQDLKQTMRMFKPPGFVDFNYTHLTLGMDLSFGKDFAVISLGTNPFAEPGSPYFALLVAGVHHPGTAHAVKFLSNADNFTKHPFGGVLEIEVPSRKCDPHEISWHNKIENCHAEWHTAGHDLLEYDLGAMRSNLSKWADHLDGVAKVVDIALEREEIERHLRLIAVLSNAKNGVTI